MERTLVILKPDAFQRRLLGRIIARFEDKGLQLVATKMMRASDELLNQHYAHIAGKPFFPEIRDFMKSTPLLVMCWEGVDVIATVRKMLGITKSRDAEPGTIRGDFAMSIQCNLVHASESLEAARKELSVFFNDSDYFPFHSIDTGVIYSSHEK